VSAVVDAGSAVPSLATELPAEVSLAQLAAQARELPGSAGAEAVVALAARLAALQPTAADGELLLSLLEAGSFHGLAGDDGTPTRALAVEALLRLGYPWSVQIHPEELAWYRDHQRRRGNQRLMILLGILAVELVGAGLYWFVL
jgi:hypothetical protein